MAGCCRPPPSISLENEVSNVDLDVSDSLKVPISENKQIISFLHNHLIRINPDPEFADPITVRSMPLKRVTCCDFRPVDRRLISVRSRLPNRPITDIFFFEF
ncbi:OLC1v1021229C1 [Oldenlandia corymbosa var. corymbosa]|uniref:OLC1v1021229C1 n=1 Tax=Oldenlandia corymbosa var. corymbosa TaxID=529605 RepID=A0AAV1BXF1_OLDCO|nr:OLC1v1021229C1 [Oldenlandia corymbosa var. corymbosa]